MCYNAFRYRYRESIYALRKNAVKEQKIAYIGGDLEFAYGKFRQLNMLKKLTEEQKRALYDEMVEGTKAYLGDYK